ncbi:response regulator [Methylosinus trichosporium OB3b]|uniref:Response regulator n=2 Tax=Methylocystaceae TaxID=31993 RepID=A0A2D2CWZ8_METT3|nr:response regulator [Methylosinus trichosporium OB3b]
MSAMAESSDGRDAIVNDDRRAQAADALTGRRVLVVEDDPFISSALEDMLTEHGCVVIGSARTVARALHLAASEQIDVALLDVSVGPERVDPVAELLAGRDCPFIFTTGYGRAGLPEAHASRAMVEKPFYCDEVIDALRSALRRSSREA